MNPETGTMIAVRNAAPGLARPCSTPKCSGMAVKEIFAHGETHGFCRRCVNGLVASAQDAYRRAMKEPM